MIQHVAAIETGKKSPAIRFDQGLTAKTSSSSSNLCTVAKAPNTANKQGKDNATQGAPILQNRINNFEFLVSSYLICPMWLRLPRIASRANQICGITAMPIQNHAAPSCGISK